MAKAQSPQEVRVVVFGDGGVGKSALVVLYTMGVFVPKYDPTIEEEYRKLTAVGAETENVNYVMLEILDSAAGSCQFSSMRDLYIKNADAFLLLYSIVARGTMDVVQNDFDQIMRVKGALPGEIPIAVVGTKIDLEDQRVVSAIEGVTLANKLQCDFMEVSAKTKINVDEVFQLIAQKVLAHKYVESLKKGKEKQNCAMM